MKKIILIFLVISLIFINQCKKSETQKIITVSILPQKYFTERIVGDKFYINVMVGPGREPHDYEPLPKQMISLSDSQLYLSIGVPFEDQLLKKIPDINSSVKIIKTQEGITLRNLSNNEDHDLHEYDSKEIKDPHIWLSPKLVKIQAENIYNAVLSIDPENKEFYENNLKKFLSDLDELSKKISAAFSGIKKKEFMVFHPAWGYFADEFGLKQIPIELEGKEPTPKQLSQIINSAKEKKIKVIFVQKQFSTNSAKALAKEINAAVVTIDPLSEDYLNNLKNIADTIIKNIKE